MLNTLSNTYKTEIAFDVTYVKMPKGKIITNDLPESIQLKIKGIGFDLMTYKLRFFKPQLKIDLSDIPSNTPYRSNKTIKNSSISTNFLKSRILSQLSRQIELEAIYPDSIRFEMDEIMEKTVQIIPKINITYKKQYQLDGSIKMKPTVVKIIGPKSILDTLEQVFTEEFAYNELDETLTESIGFNKVYKSQKIQFEEEQALLHIPVAKYTESSAMITLDYINVPDSVTIKAIPNEVEVKFMLPLNKIANKNNSEMKATIDFKEINEKFNSKLKVNLSDYPDYINSIVINPSKVEYILQKRN